MSGPDDELENESGAFDEEPPPEWQDPEYAEWLADHLADLGERHTDYLEDR